MVPFSTTASIRRCPSMRVIGSTTILAMRSPHLSVVLRLVLSRGRFFGRAVVCGPRALFFNQFVFAKVGGDGMCPHPNQRADAQSCPNFVIHAFCSESWEVVTALGGRLLVA